MKVLKITNKKTGQVQQSDFATTEECEAHFQKYKAVGFWGKEAHTIRHEEQVIHHEEELIHLPEVVAVNEDGTPKEPKEILTPARTEVVNDAYDEVIPAYDEQIPAEYTYVIEDHTAEVEAKKAKEETKKSDRVSRVTSLKAIDWATIDTIAELKVIVRHLVKESLKDDE